MSEKNKLYEGGILDTLFNEQILRMLKYKT